MIPLTQIQTLSPNALATLASFQGFPNARELATDYARGKARMAGETGATYRRVLEELLQDQLKGK